MHLADLLHHDAIKVPLDATERRAAIDELVDLLADHGGVGDPDALKAAVWNRESVRSTGVGHGLAIPHGRSDRCDRLVMAVGKPPRPIDFRSVDGRDVSIIFLLAGPPDQAGPHIQALARISRLMTRPAFRNAVLDAPDAQAVYDLLTQEDAAPVP